MTAKNPTPLTQERLRELLEYDLATGIFKWRVSQGCRKRGVMAGSFQSNGYMEIRIDGAKQKVQRLAWLYMTGEWPRGQIDHFDETPSNNRWNNLRDVTQSGNLQNQSAPHSQNKLGHLGIYWDKKKRKFVAKLNVNGRCVFFKRFQTLKEAMEAHAKAKITFHPYTQFVPSLQTLTILAPPPTTVVPIPSAAVVDASVT